jgi:transposase
MDETPSAQRWSVVRAMSRQGLSQRQIAAQLGLNRRTVARLVDADEPPRYRRAPTGSMLDRFQPAIDQILKDQPYIKATSLANVLRSQYGYGGSTDLVRKRLAQLRSNSVDPPARTDRRAGEVLELRWSDLTARSAYSGKTHRLYALIASLPFSEAQTACFSFDPTAESLLECHVRVLAWLGGVPKRCVYRRLPPTIREVSADGKRAAQSIDALGRHYGFRPLTSATPGENTAVDRAYRQLTTGFWPHRSITSLGDLESEYGFWRDEISNRTRVASYGFSVSEGLAIERSRLASLPERPFHELGRRFVRVDIGGYVDDGERTYRVPEQLVDRVVEMRFDHDRVWIGYRGRIVAHHVRGDRPSVRSR